MVSHRFIRLGTISREWRPTLIQHQRRNLHNPLTCCTSLRVVFDQKYFLTLASLISLIWVATCNMVSLVVTVDCGMEVDSLDYSPPPAEPGLSGPAIIPLHWTTGRQLEINKWIISSNNSLLWRPTSPPISPHLTLVISTEVIPRCFLQCIKFEEKINPSKYIINFNAQRMYY